MVKAKHKIIIDDIVYLMEVVERIERVSKLGESSDINERVVCIQKVSYKIRLFLEKVLTVS